MRQIVSGPHIGISAIGSILPFPFGRPRGVLGQPILVGAQASLREAVDTSQTVFKLDSLDSLNRFADSGTFVIEAEACTWSSRDFDQIALIVSSRHAMGTSAASHAIGVQLSEQVDPQIYAFYNNPGGFIASSIDAVYVNGLLKAPDVQPTHEVSVADMAAMHDAVTGGAVSVGTATFDMDPVTTPSSPFVTPQSLAAYQTWKQAHDSLTQQWWTFMLQNPAGWQGGVGPPGVEASPQGNQAYAIQVAFAQLGRAPKLLPQLGTVTADVTGLLDDASGSITGTPGLLIRNPVHCARLILQEAFRQTRFDDDSFAAAALECDNRGYAWDFVYFPTTLGELQTNVFTQSWVVLFRESGVWKARYRQRGTLAMVLRQARRVSFTMSWTPMNDVITDVNVKYGTGDNAKALTVHSDRGAKLRTANPMSLELPYVTDATQAEGLGQLQLRLRDHQRRMAVALMHSEALPLERVDTIGVESPLLDAYGGAALYWKVKAIRFTPERLLEIPLEEDDDAALNAQPGAVPITGTAVTLHLMRLGGAAPGSVPITGTAVTFLVSRLLTAAPGSVPITGTAATLTVGSAAVYDGDAYFGKSYFGNAYFG